jgi:hypothetical protein
LGPFFKQTNKAKELMMSDIRDFQIFYDDFNGAVATLPTSADPATPWLVDDTSSSGTPVYTKGTSELTVTLAATNEIENVCPHFNDALDFDIDLVQRVEMRVKIGASTFTSREYQRGFGGCRLRQGHLQASLVSDTARPD